MNPVDFLRLLWGDEPPGLIQLWRLEGRRSQYLRAPAGAGGLEGSIDTYTAVALAHKDHGRYRRASADQAAGIPGLWCDIDVNGGPENKTGVAPSKNTALELTIAVAPPTVVVDSGYGLHAWWLLHTPWRFRSRDEQQTAALMSAQWYALHRGRAQQNGWTVDHTHDLARLLRLPGTINGKGGHQIPVQLLQDGGPRYARDELQDLCSLAGDVLLEGLGDSTGPAALPDIVARADAHPPSVKVDALRVNDAEFAATMDHRRSDAKNWSLSEYDMSLATQAARANFTDQELADLIAYHRRLHDPSDTKGRRVDYLRRTIAKARENATRADAASRLRDLAARGRAA